jgi:SAM-dependent methyltransferase
MILKEKNIRPTNLFEEYLRLSSEDAEKCFGDVERVKISCPACESNESKKEFVKNGFEYVSCMCCRTLYLNPRPTIESFEKFYNSSISSNYWAETFFPAVAESRRELIFRPRVKRLQSLCCDMDISPKVVMDVGAGYGIFLEEFKEEMPDIRTIAIEPSKNLADICRKKGFEVVEDIAEKVSGYESAADLVVCFEVLEHIHNPLQFVSTLSKFVAPGGYLMVSTLGVDGFDIQMLWEKSNSVSPPHHINFFSVEGFRRLFERAGMIDINITTPGVLDVDIVRNAFQSDPSVLEGQRFLQKVIEDDKLAEYFQDFLKSSKLSSHTWVLAKKI